MADSKRRILLIALGTTPHLLTFTLAALYKESPEAMPTEIRIVTTELGAEMARRSFFGEGNILDAFWRDYGLSPAAFTEADIHAISSADGEPIADIRTLDDSNRAADLIVKLVRELPRGLGDVTVLWIGEPDHSSHEFGIDDERTREARRDADRQFARVLEWWETEGRDAGVQLVVMSDHGHGVVRRHFDMKGILEKAGLSILMGREVLEGTDTASADAVLVGTYCAGLWFTNPADLSLQLRARDALMTSPDIGLLFSPSDPEQPCSIEGRIPGTFSERLVFTDGRRSPDLRIVPRGDPETGGLVMAPELPLGAGNHGGLLPQEINAVLAVGGSAFPGSAVHDDPAGHADLAVTIMTLEGLLSGSDMVKPTGRLLDEALPGGPVRRTPAGEAFDLTFGAFHQRIERLSSGGRAYVTCAHRINNDGWTPERGLPEGARTDDDD